MEKILFHELGQWHRRLCHPLRRWAHFSELPLSNDANPLHSAGIARCNTAAILARVEMVFEADFYVKSRSSMSMVALEDVFVVTSSAQPSLVSVAVICTSIDYAAVARLIGMHLLHGFLQRFKMSIGGVIDSLKQETEAQSMQYTLSSALQGQSLRESTLEPFTPFETAVIDPLFCHPLYLLPMNTPNNCKALIVNYELCEVVAQTTESEEMSSILLAAVYHFAAQIAVSSTPLVQTIQPTQQLNSRDCYQIALTSFPVPGFGAAVIYHSSGTWLQSLAIDKAPSRGTKACISFNNETWYTTHDIERQDLRDMLQQMCLAFSQEKLPPMDSPRLPELAT